MGGADGEPEGQGEEDEEPVHEGPCSEAGTEIIDLINDYRLENDLPIVPISTSLCTVAQAHVEDLAENKPYEAGEECSLQSWSEAAPAEACCYLVDNSNPECMWEKPQEMTEYPTYGYESVAVGPLSPLDAVEHFKNVEAHVDLILERASWINVDWMAIGAAYQDGHATLWFGADPDPADE
jgi:hypothetical protein